MISKYTLFQSVLEVQVNYKNDSHVHCVRSTQQPGADTPIAYSNLIIELARQGSWMNPGYRWVSSREFIFESTSRRV